MKERSGRPSVRGVGTVTTATSNPAQERLSLDAWIPARIHGGLEILAR